MGDTIRIGAIGGPPARPRRISDSEPRPWAGTLFTKGCPMSGGVSDGAPGGSPRAFAPPSPRLFLRIFSRLARKLCTSAYAHSFMLQTVKFESKSVKTGSKSCQNRVKNERKSSCPS
jgi:hypothetical protein